MNDKPNTEALLAAAFAEAVAGSAISGPVDHDRLRELIDSLDIRITRDGAGDWRASR